MNEFIPYLLLLVAWHPDHPGKIEVDRAPGAFSSQADCEAAGAELLTQKDTFIVKGSGGQMMVRCIPSASSAEQEAAWAPIQERLEAEGVARRLREEQAQVAKEAAEKAKAKMQNPQIEQKP